VTYPDDWDNFEGNGSISVESTNFVGGNASIRMGGASGFHEGVCAVHSPSISEAPTDVQVITYGMLDDTRGSVASLYAQVQTDGSRNFAGGYALEACDNDAEVRLTELSGSSLSNSVDNRSSYSASLGGWNKYRLRMWDGGGTIYGRIEYDDGSTWTQLGKDVSLSATYSGGGVGVGSSVQYTGDTLHDNTEVYY